MRYKKTAAVLAAALLLGGCGAGNNSQGNAADTDPAEIPSETGEIFAMDTYMTITCYGENCSQALEASLAEIERLDELLSVGNEESEIAQINKNGSGPVSEDTLDMLNCALEVYDTTGGAFDITIYPLMELWGFTSGDFQVPAEELIGEYLENVDAGQVQITEAEDGSTTFDGEKAVAEVTIGSGQGIDLGGIAKGFTSSRLMEIFADYDLVSGLVSLGGNVQVYGTKVDGSMWKCGITDPNDPDGGSLMGILQIADEAVITSGAYERNFTDEQTGRVYHHIIDPKTGYSADNGIVSSTIVTPDGMLADALSTACYVMGLEDSLEYWQEYGDDFDLILMTEKNEIYITEGLEDRFTSDYPVTVIYKEEKE